MHEFPIIEKIPPSHEDPVKISIRNSPSEKIPIIPTPRLTPSPRPHHQPHHTSPRKISRRLRRGPLRRHVRPRHAAVDDEVGPVDEAALVAGEEEDGVRLLDGLAEAAGGKVDFAAVALGGVVAEPVLEERGAGEGEGWFE